MDAHLAVPDRRRNMHAEAAAGADADGAVEQFHGQLHGELDQGELEQGNQLGRGDLVRAAGEGRERGVGRRAGFVVAIEELHGKGQRHLQLPSEGMCVVGHQLRPVVGDQDGHGERDDRGFRA